MEAEDPLLTAAPAPTRDGASTPHNPFVGPRSFNKGETLFGRDREAQEIVDLLISERIVLLYSPSGAGKTSLIQAKLVPMMEREGFAVRPIVRVAQESTPDDLRAGSANRHLLSTMRSLEVGLSPETQMPPASLAGMTLRGFLEATRPAGVAAGDTELIIFDQFEEILTVDANSISEKEKFFDQVGDLLRDKARWALFSMREDFVPALDPYLRQIPRRLATRFRLDLLDVNAARKAILGPSQAEGRPIPARIVDELVKDLRQVRIQKPGGVVQEPGPYIEPVQLQVVCYRSWDNLLRTGRLSDSQAEIAIGDVDAALAGYYSDCVAAVAAAKGVPERALRDWCESQLITEQGIRGQVLREFPTSRGLVYEAITGLIDAHLVRAEERRGATWFELAHDRLIEPVRASNLAWRERNLNRFQLCAAQWAKTGCPAALLFAGVELKSSERWAATQPAGSMTADESEFLDACRDAESAVAEREQSMLMKRMLAVAAAALLIVIVAAFVFKRHASQLQKTIDERDETARNLRNTIIERNTYAGRLADETAKVTAEKERAVEEEKKARASAEREKSAKIALSRELDEKNLALKAKQDAYNELEAKKNGGANQQGAKATADPDPLSVTRSFPNRSIVVRYAAGIDINEPPILVDLDGVRVVKAKEPKIDRFNVVEIYEAASPESWPLIWSDIVANTYFRPTYQKSGSAGAKLGTSIVGMPSFHRAGEVFDFIPAVAKAEVFAEDSDRVRSEIMARFGPLINVSSLRTYLRPRIGRTTTLLSVDLEAKQDILLDKAMLGNDACRLLTISSMFSDRAHYDANRIRFLGQNRAQSKDLKGGIRELMLREDTPRDQYLLLDESKAPRAVELGDVGDGRWFELLKDPGSSWGTDSPSISVQLRNQRGNVGGIFPRFAVQGWLDKSTLPSNDSLSVWIEWLNAPEMIPAGTKVGLDVTIVAYAPRPDEWERDFEGGALKWVSKSDLRDAAVPATLNGEAAGEKSIPGGDLFNVLEIYDKTPNGKDEPLIWSENLATATFRPTYQKADANGKGAELGTGVAGFPAFATADGTLHRPQVTGAGLVKVEDTRRLLGEFAMQFGAMAKGRSTLTHPNPILGETVSLLAIEFEAIESIRLNVKLRGNEAFRLLSLPSIYKSKSEYNANVVRYVDPSGKPHAMRLEDRLREAPADRGRFLFVDDNRSPRAVEIGESFELIKEPGLTSYFPDSPSIEVKIVRREGIKGRLGIQGWLDVGEAAPNSLNVWLEWIDAPEVIEPNTKMKIEYLVIAKPPERVATPR